MNIISSKHNYKVIGIFLSFILVISLSFCNSPTNGKAVTESSYLKTTEADLSSDIVSDTSKAETPGLQSPELIPYDLDNPDETYFMPDYLRELSGLAYYKDDKILCIQDETAEIYVLSLGRKGIINKYGFGKKGDYEDIAVDKQTAWVSRSDGRIFRIDNFEMKTRKVTEYKTPLSVKNDVEGLAFDISSNSLLIACKGSPSTGKGNQFKGYKAIYKSGLPEINVGTEPAILINLKQSESFIDDETFRKFSQLHNNLSGSDKDELRLEPSGISFHPRFPHIYLISSTNKLLLVLDRKGKILSFMDLDHKLFIQPEGICFSPSGDMFISNEGRNDKGNILRFNLRLKQ